jgi:hypothetical protein
MSRAYVWAQPADAIGARQDEDGTIALIVGDARVYLHRDQADQLQVSLAALPVPVDPKDP